MSQMNPVHTLRVYSLKIHVIILLSGALYEREQEDRRMKHFECKYY
jgi:hypothetical protein